MTTALPTATLIERLQAVKPQQLRVYLRQSKEEKDQPESVRTQRGECERLATAIGKGHLWKDRVEYIDVDRSGDDITREDLNRLLVDAKTADVVLAWKQDRVGRDMIDSAHAIRELARYRNCELFTVETGTKQIKMDTAEETTAVMLRGMISQGELERIRSRTRDGLRQRARDGYAAGPTPFGYRRVLENPNVTDRKKSKKRIEIEPAHAAVVQRIFSLYLEEKGSAGIAALLNKEGAPSPNGAFWAPRSIWDILRQAHYTGQWCYGKTKAVGRQQKKSIVRQATEQELIRIERPDLVIIQPEMFARVQADIEKRQKEMSSDRSATNLLTGILRCDVCGGNMAAQKNSKTRGGYKWSRRYYRCRKNQHKACTNNAWLPSEEVEPKIVDYIQTTVLDELAAQKLGDIQAEVRRVADTSTAHAEKVDALRTELAQLQKERARLVQLARTTEESIPEIADDLKANQQRAGHLQHALNLASRTPMGSELAERLEAAALVQVERMRERLSGAEAREAILSLFPKGLRFKVGNGLWLVEGGAVLSVPCVNQTDAVRGSDDPGNPAQLRRSEGGVEPYRP